ncbi:MAG: hypothetical protein JW763_04090 [candidate division Zixibacteria bacterium]|nr:hypothetical protein [candidate division Zixibacteria bacterium]
MSLSLNFTIEADVDRRLIVEKIYGIWKKETAEEYHQEFVKTAQPLIAGKWAKLINLGNWKTSYPEVVEIVGDHLRWCRENGMVLSVNVIENPITLNQLKRMFEHGATAKISRIAKTMQEGERILRENGF